jgi:hypothetical protein
MVRNRTLKRVAMSRFRVCDSPRVVASSVMMSKLITSSYRRRCAQAADVEPARACGQHRPLDRPADDAT